MDLLQKQETVFIYSKINERESEVKNDTSMRRNNTVGEWSKTGSDISTELPARERDPFEYHKQNSSIPKLGLDEAQAVTESVLMKDDRVFRYFRNFINTAARFCFYASLFRSPIPPRQQPVFSSQKWIKLGTK